MEYDPNYHQPDPEQPPVEHAQRLGAWLRRTHLVNKGSRHPNRAEQRRHDQQPSPINFRTDALGRRASFLAKLSAAVLVTGVGLVGEGLVTGTKKAFEHPRRAAGIVAVALVAYVVYKEPENIHGHSAPSSSCATDGVTVDFGAHGMTLNTLTNDVNTQEGTHYTYNQIQASNPGLVEAPQGGRPVTAQLNIGAVGVQCVLLPQAAH